MKRSTALIVGANQGIGLALVKNLLDDGLDQVHATHRPQRSENLEALAQTYSDRLHLHPLTAECPEDYPGLASRLVSTTDRIDLLIHCIGRLQGESLSGPEKRVEEVTVEGLDSIFRVNAYSFPLLIAPLKDFLKNSDGPRIAALSAKVGSIEDNRSGGWYGYRASKAALNMFVRNVAFELQRSHPGSLVVALHPGTTETGLTAPFIESARKKYTVHAPEETATNLLKQLGRSDLQTGGFYQWDGAPLPW